jgi:hypothetical protein
MNAMNLVLRVHSVVIVPSAISPVLVDLFPADPVFDLVTCNFLRFKRIREFPSCGKQGSSNKRSFYFQSSVTFRRISRDFSC